jgi:hypothetical protein
MRNRFRALISLTETHGLRTLLVVEAKHLTNAFRRPYQTGLSKEAGW